MYEPTEPQYDCHVNIPALMSTLLSNMRVFVFVLLVFLGNANLELFGQGMINTPVSGNYENIPVVELVQILENTTGARILYDPDRIPYFRVSIDLQETPLFKALTQIVSGTTLTVAYSGDMIVLIDKIQMTRENVRGIIEKWASGEYEKPIKSEAEELRFEFGVPHDRAGVQYMLKGTVR
jgi:hypothetical protein